MRKLSIFCPLILAILSLPLFSQDSEAPKIKWEKGPTLGDLGGIAQINVPKGYSFTGKKGAQTILELTHNLLSGDEVGAMVPNSAEQNWFVIFEFHGVGLVKDEEKDTLNSAALLESIKKGTEEENDERKKKGWPAFHVLSWETPPFYDGQSHNLTWAIRGESESGHSSINHSVRLLGRRGIMSVDLIMGPEEYATTLPDFNNLLSGFSFQQGSRYADFVRGDKVAEYGLSALILGGAGALAVKSGFLAQAGKLILVAILALKKLLIVALAAVAAAFRKLWGWITRRQEKAAYSSAALPEQTRVGDHPNQVHHE